MGLRGRNGDRVEGGHRVPFFMGWKDGKIKGRWDINKTTAHVNIMPTLAKLCNIKTPEATILDGVDVSSLLLKEEEKLIIITIFVHNRQDWRPPSLLCKISSICIESKS